MAVSHVSDDFTTDFDVKIHLVEDTSIKPIPSQTRSARALRNSRIKRLAIFLLLEWFWLGFGLLLRFKIRPGITGFNPYYAESTAAFVWSKYGLSSIIGVLWQFISAVPIVDMIREIYSGEWWFIRDKMDRKIDRVSTLTSGFVDQLKHTLAGGATLNFRIGFVIALLLLLLRSVAPSAISPGPYYPSSQADITIGLLRPDLTQVSDTRANPFGNQGQAQIAQSKANELAQKVVRFEYVTMVEQSAPDFAICDPSSYPCARGGHILFGMPNRQTYMDFYDDVSLYSITYHSDAVTFDFKCQWLAPELQGGIGVNTTWSFGDMMGQVDYQAVVNTVMIPYTFGIYPLQVTAGEGSSNGSFAWFIYGLADQSDQSAVNFAKSSDSGATGIIIDLSSIPSNEKTVGLYDWTIITSDPGFEPPNITSEISTMASVLFCDPQMKFGDATIAVADSGVTLWALEFNEGEGSTGNLDRSETSRMLGRSLNGIPWDSAVITAQETSSKLSRLAAEFLFNPPMQDVESSPSSIWVPQDLQNISDSLNRYTQIAGMSAYLDGNEGSKNVSAVFAHSVDILEIRWLEWTISVSLVGLIIVLVLALTVHDFRKKNELVPFTLDGIQKYYAPINQKLDEEV